MAIPVSGDCELVQGERQDLRNRGPGTAAPDGVTFVAGLLRTGGKTVPLLDLDQVVAHCIQSIECIGQGGEAMSELGGSHAADSGD